MHHYTLKTSAKLPNWKAELANAVTSVAELLRLLELDPDDGMVLPKPGFRLLVPRGFVNKMQAGNPDDPLLRQVLPLAVERAPGGYRDPVGDLDAMPSPGLVHKYRGRVLLLTTGACAIHCRYCFRRHFPYASANPCKSQWQQALDYLKAHADIEEVILSGGDPLVVDNDKLGQLLDALEQISHLRWLRIHTRLPVVLPARIDDALTLQLRQRRFRTTLVIHANHANELMCDEADALQRLATSGVTLLNQSVLLKGVNDSATTLIALSKRLYEFGVLPYYLHLLDPAEGVMHFDVPQSRAIAILDALQAALPGFLVPRLVREIPGAASKTAIFTI
ncbi:MAG: EF-P beta-lysylation protein EpmB [Gammaproteobacteria bacterium]|nr:EF-P beta-lysylation protein EpmB [Gammaproteobacteria bacterium]